MFEDEVDTDDIRPETTTSIYESRNAKTATIPNDYAEFAGVTKESDVVWRPYCGPHGNYLVLHVKGEQPEEGVVEGIFISHGELKEADNNGDSSSKR